MANWSILKAAIAKSIKNNGNQEITGQVLQNVLNNIVSSVGENASFVDVATPSTNPGTPDGKVFYLASKAGIYSNFSSKELKEGINVLLWDGTYWHHYPVYIMDGFVGKYINEVNISKLFPNNGINNSDKYTLEMALTKIPNIFNIKAGFKISFKGEYGISKEYVWSGTNPTTNASNWLDVGIDRFDELKNGVQNGYVSNSGNKQSLFYNMGHIEIPYTKGDVIEVIGGNGGSSYKKYNFFQDDTFISCADSLDVIPDNCTKIIVNTSNISSYNPIRVIINGKPYNIFADIYLATEDIQKNTEDIQKNTEDIQKNTEDIQKNTEDVSANSNELANIFSTYNDGFYFVDVQGNILAKITKDGIQCINFIGKDGNPITAEQQTFEEEDGTVLIIKDKLAVPAPLKVHPLYGKSIYSFGDSLCKGTWEQHLADITGAIFNKEANDLTSWGGTFSGDVGGPLYNEEGYGKNGDMPGGTRRAKNFVAMPKETYGNKDVILFENVHDGETDADRIKTAMPFMWSRYAIYEGQEFAGDSAQEDANSFFNSNLSSILSSVDFTSPQVGTIIKLKIVSVNVPITFTSGASNSGSVKITIAGHDFETQVSAGDSIEQVVDKISVWSFSDSTAWKNVKGANNLINLQFAGGNGGSKDDAITFDAQGTGVVATVGEKNTSLSYRCHAFMSLDIANYNSTEHWSYYANYNKPFESWKAIIEYIQKNCPETKMYMCLFPNSSYSDSYTRPDGSFDVEAFYNSSNQKEHVNNRTCLIAVANYYNIPIIDVEKEMMVMSNWKTYYNPNNVHMKNSLYKRMAEIIASKIY